jgi:hypothetical protein
VIRTCGISAPDETQDALGNNIRQEGNNVAAEESDFMEAVSKMADSMGLTGDARDEYLEQHATKRGGYKKVVTWVKDDKAGNEGGEGEKKKGWYQS